MPVNVRIPSPLRKYTKDQDTVAIQAANVGELITALEAAAPGIKERLVDDTGTIRRFVNIYVRDEDIRFLDNLKTPLKDGDEVSIVPAIAGGR